MPVDPRGTALGLPLTLLGTFLTHQAETAADAANRVELERAAKQADAQAADALWRGSLLSGRARMAGSATVAEQKVAFANSGVDAGTGTAANVAGATRMVSEYEAQNLANNAAREAWGHKEVGRKYRVQSAAIARQMDARDAALGVQVAGAGLQMGASFLGGGL